ncbi:hypothetical protein BKA70DRAFT_1244851, partial [Coprinopsis sp. MPI-PUGE-AT-0042]
MRKLDSLSLVSLLCVFIILILLIWLLAAVLLEDPSMASRHSIQFLPYTNAESPEFKGTDILSYYVYPRTVRRDEIWGHTTGVPVLTSLSDALLAQSRWVFTSPNDPNIAHMTFGRVHGRARKDGLYGFQDRSCAPQLYCEGFVYYSTIPTFCEHLPKLWWTPTKGDTFIIPGNGLNIPLRFLRSDVITEFKAYRAWYISEVGKAFDKLGKRDTGPSLLVTHMCQTLECLCTGLLFKDIIWTVAEFRRTCLDIHGWLNYVNIYYPRQFEYDKTYPVDTSAMGTFTFSDQIASQCLKMGVPVYLICPNFLISSITNVAEDAKRMFMTANPKVVTDDYEEDELYHGLPRVEQQKALQRIGCQVLDLKDVCRIGDEPASPSTSRLSAATASPSEIVLTGSDLAWIPTNKASITLAELQDTNITGMPNHEIIVEDMPSINLDTPPEIPLWKSILEEFGGQRRKDIEKSAEASTPQKPANAYSRLMLPPPHLLRRDGSNNKSIYLAAWLVSRAGYMHTLVHLVDTKARSPSSQQWRNFLFRLKHCLAIDMEESDDEEPIPASATKRTHDGVPIVGSSSLPLPTPPPASSGARAPRQQKKKKKPRVNSQQRDHSVLSAMPLRHGDVQEIIWLDSQILLNSVDELADKLTPAITAEVLWELHEMGFRLELLALDQALAPEKWSSGSVSRELVIRKVFPSSDGKVAEFFVSSIPNRNQGLASFAWKERLQSISALRNLMLSWSTCSSSIRNSPPLTKINSQEAAACVERDVVEFYFSAFTNHFDRLPIPPVRLPYASRVSHLTSLPRSFIFRMAEGWVAAKQHTRKHVKNRRYQVIQQVDLITPTNAYFQSTPSPPKPNITMPSVPPVIHTFRSGMAQPAMSAGDKRLRQFSTWTETVLPQLLPTYLTLLSSSNNLANIRRSPGSCTCPRSVQRIIVDCISFDGISHYIVCSCAPARQLLVAGFFPTAPLFPTMAVDVRMLEFMRELYLCSPPNRSAWSSALESFYGRQGIILTGSDIICHKVAKASQYYALLRLQARAFVRNKMLLAHQLVLSEDDTDPDCANDWEDISDADAKHEYLKRCCLLCFTTLERDPTRLALSCPLSLEISYALVHSATSIDIRNDAAQLVLVFPSKLNRFLEMPLPNVELNSVPIVTKSSSASIEPILNVEFVLCLRRSSKTVQLIEYRSITRLSALSNLKMAWCSDPSELTVVLCAPHSPNELNHVVHIARPGHTPEKLKPYCRSIQPGAVTEVSSRLTVSPRFDPPSSVCFRVFGELTMYASSNLNTAWCGDP